MSLSEEASANLSRAEASLKAAKLLLESNLPDDAASRAYYAAFSSATALLIEEGLSFKSHSGLLRALSLHFVKTGRLTKEANDGINRLAEIRSLGDYGDIEHVTRGQADWSVATAESFITQVKNLLGGE